MTLTPTFHGHRAFHLAGNRAWHTFADAPRTIPPQWHALDGLALPNRAEATETFGVTSAMDMPNQRFEYFAGYEVEDLATLPAGVDHITVPRAHYAVFTLASVSEIPALWRNIFDTWLPSTGHKAADSPNFERYDERFDPVTRGPLEIWFPIDK